MTNGNWQAVAASLVMAMFTMTTTTSAESCRPPNLLPDDRFPRYYAPGERVEMRCIARGGEPLVYTWTKNGAPFNVGHGSDERIFTTPGHGSLVISRGEADDAGYYQCKATNRCGTSVSIVKQLIISVMEPFPALATPQRRRFTEGESAVLRCNPPRSIPKPRMFWVSGDFRRPVDLDERVTMDYDGNLYFTNIQRSDAQDSKEYICVASNPVLRTSNLGSDTIINVRREWNRNPRPRPTELMWTSPSDMVVLEGEEAEMKCIFSGNPQPSTTWQRIDGQLDNARTIRTQHELIIRRVQPSDAGRYRCAGTNDGRSGWIDHVFTLVVKSKPRWQYQPDVDAVYYVGDSATFRCSAVGNPTPSVRWFINGEPIEDQPSDPRRQLNADTLTFYNVTKDDSLVVQCNASNEHGFIWSDAPLFVSGEPPSFNQTPPAQGVVAVGQELKVACRVQGEPQPRVNWFKGQDALTQSAGRIRVMNNGDLVITNISMQDSGVYSCQAQNRFGDVTADSKLLVKQRTVIISRSPDLMVEAPYNGTFSCEAVTDPSMMANLTYIWLKDGRGLEPSERIIKNAGELTITNTRSGDDGNYTCVATNGVDNASTTALLRVIDVPSPPTNLYLESCHPHTVSFIWHYDSSLSNSAPVDKFIVEMITQREMEAGEEWRVAKEIVLSDMYGPTFRTDVILPPNGRYKLRVRAVNRMGAGNPSDGTYDWCSTPPSRPYVNPNNVYTDESETGLLVIKWEPLKREETNAAGFRYRVQTIKQDDTRDTRTYIKYDYRDAEVLVPVNGIYEPYLITVQSENDLGSSLEPPAQVLGHSGEFVPSVTPQNFDLDPEAPVTSSGATFEWDAVDTSTSTMNGRFRGYVIKFRETDDNSTVHTHFVSGEGLSGDTVRATVTGLPGLATLRASVAAVNGNFESPASAVVQFETPEGVPGPVADLQVVQRGSHHVLVEWTAPSQPNGHITGYRVAYGEISSVDQQWATQEYDDRNRHQAVLGGLEPDSQYRIKVQATTQVGIGQEILIEAMTLSDEEALTMPTVTHVDARDTEAYVTVELNATSTTSRHGQVYTIDYKKSSSASWQQTTFTAQANTTQLHLTNLDPGTAYQVRASVQVTEGGPALTGQMVDFNTTGKAEQTV